MFENLGKKIQIVAYVITIIGIVLSFIYGFLLLKADKALVGFSTIIIGSLASWLGSFVLYGFGIIVQWHETHQDITTCQPKRENSPLDQPFWQCYSCNTKIYDKNVKFCPECGIKFQTEEDKEKEKTLSFLQEALSTEEVEKLRELLNK